MMSTDIIIINNDVDDDDVDDDDDVLKNVKSLINIFLGHPFFL